MPLTAKGEEIKTALTKEYGKEKGERVLYAGKNKGTFTGIDCETLNRIADAVDSLSARFDAKVDADNEAHNKEWALKVAKWKSQWTPEEKKAVEKYNPDLAASREKQKAK